MTDHRDIKSRFGEIQRKLSGWQRSHGRNARLRTSVGEDSQFIKPEPKGHSSIPPASREIPSKCDWKVAEMIELARICDMSSLVSTRPVANLSQTPILGQGNLAQVRETPRFQLSPESPKSQIVSEEDPATPEDAMVMKRSNSRVKDSPESRIYQGIQSRTEAKSRSMSYMTRTRSPQFEQLPNRLVMVSWEDQYTIGNSALPKYEPMTAE
jgi:hypothetical protein